MLKMLNYKFYSDFFYPRNLQEIRGIFFIRAVRGYFLAL